MFKCYVLDGTLAKATSVVVVESVSITKKPNYDVINDVISGFAKVVVEGCGFHHWIAHRISWSEVVSVFLYLL